MFLVYDRYIEHLGEIIKSGYDGVIFTKHGSFSG